MFTSFIFCLKIDAQGMNKPQQWLKQTAMVEIGLNGLLMESDSCIISNVVFSLKYDMMEHATEFYSDHLCDKEHLQSL